MPSSVDGLGEGEALTVQSGKTRCDRLLGVAGPTSWRLQNWGRDDVADGGATSGYTP